MALRKGRWRRFLALFGMIMLSAMLISYFYLFQIFIASSLGGFFAFLWLLMTVLAFAAHLRGLKRDQQKTIYFRAKPLQTKVNISLKRVRMGD